VPPNRLAAVLTRDSRILAARGDKRFRANRRSEAGRDRHQPLTSRLSSSWRLQGDDGAIEQSDHAGAARCPAPAASGEAPAFSPER
jgi:hypothetical protein